MNDPSNLSSWQALYDKTHLKTFFISKLRDLKISNWVLVKEVRHKRIY